MKDKNTTTLPGFDPQSFGKRLQSARKALGITQEEFAAQLRVDCNHISRMERGVRVCSIDLLVEMAALLDVSTDYLLVGTAMASATKQKLLTAINELNTIVQSL